MAVAEASGLVAVHTGEDTVSVPDFEAFMETYRPRVFRFALASLRDRDLAETVTQDCFFKAYRGWRQFRGDSDVQTWLMRIAVNVIRDVARSRRLQFWKRTQTNAVGLDEATEWIRDRAPSPEDRVVARQQVAVIWRLVARLSERQRTVFLLHFLEGMNTGEIEAVTSISRGAIKVHLFRAIHAIREKLGNP